MAIVESECEEGIVSTSWSWVEAKGSDVVCFDSSASLLQSEACASPPDGSLLILRRPSPSTPCDLTVCFRQSHEIHRIYVRSTARVYEIYLALNQPSESNEYLCTVRCGPSETQSFLPEINDENQTITESKISSNQALSSSENNSTNGNSDEDGWVDIKVPDSSTLNERMESLSVKNDQTATSNVQVCFEATAEISEASPCTSLTIRLLSLQHKECVYVEEIYIYADPVPSESTDSESTMYSGNSMAGSSLLAMLVPGLLQLPKNESRSTPERASDTSVVDKLNVLTAENSEKSNSKTGTLNPDKGDHQIASENKIGEQDPFVKPPTTHVDWSPQFPVSNNMGHSVSGETNAALGRVENVLNELVSRVGQIEKICVSFEEKMVKPLSSIETRLQQLEQQLSMLTTDSFVTSKFSAPERSSHEHDSEQVIDGNGYVVRENICSEGLSSPPELSATPVLDLNFSPGLVFTVPEFPQDDDLCTNHDNNTSLGDRSFSEDDVSSNVQCDDPGKINKDMDSAVDDCSKEKSLSGHKAPFSLKTALDSELEAFLSSATHGPTKLENTLEEPKVSDNHINKDRPVEFSPEIHFEVAEGIHSNDFSKCNDGKLSDFDAYSSCIEDFSELGMSVNGHMDQFQTARQLNSYNTLPGDAVGPNVSTVPPMIDHDTVEAGDIATNRFSVDKEWNNYSSSESSAEEGMNLDRCGTIWTDKSSTDSRDDDFPLRNWISSQAQHVQQEKSEDERGPNCCMLAGVLDDLSTNTAGKSGMGFVGAVKSSDNHEHSRDDDFPLRNWLAARAQKVQKQNVEVEGQGNLTINAHIGSDIEIEQTSKFFDGLGHSSPSLNFDHPDKMSFIQRLMDGNLESSEEGDFPLHNFVSAGAQQSQRGDNEDEQKTDSDINCRKISDREIKRVLESCDDHNDSIFNVQFGHVPTCDGGMLFLQELSGTSNVNHENGSTRAGLESCDDHKDSIFNVQFEHVPTCDGGMLFLQELGGTSNVNHENGSTRAGLETHFSQDSLDLNETVFVDQFLMDVGDSPAMKFPKQMEEIGAPTVSGHELPFSSLI